MNTKPLIVAKIPASHKLAVEFNTDLEKMAVRRTEVVSDLTAKSKDEFRKLKLVYAYTAVEAHLEPFLHEEVKRKQPVRIVRTWVNKESFMNLALIFGVAAPNVPDQVVSHVYYVVNNLLVKAEGHGRDLLNVNIPVSDHEWSELRDGRPADKLLKRA